MDYTRYFDQVVLINLKRRQDRLLRIQSVLRESHWPFQWPEVIEAIDGVTLDCPANWQHGPGAWGTMLTHRKVLESAIQRGVNSLLVLEDDVCLVENFRQEMIRFLQAVPADWDLLMIGGQHRNQTEKPTLIKPGVWRCRECERMHCYAIRGDFMRKFHQRLQGGGKFKGLAHCDWILASDPEMQQSHKVYAPEYFLAGQERGRSDINGAVQPRKFWNPPGPALSVIYLRAPLPVALALHQQGFYWRHVFVYKDGRRKSLEKILEEAGDDSVARTANLSDCIKAMQWEVASDPAYLCTLWESQVSLEMVQAASLWPVYEITAVSTEEAFDQLPPSLRQQVLPGGLWDGASLDNQSGQASH